MDREIGVDITNIIADLQKMVVSMKDESDLNRVTNKASSLREVMRHRNEGIHAVKSQRSINGDISDEERPNDKKNANCQLLELNEENRNLRELYEESMLTLDLLMKHHRSSMQTRSESRSSSTVAPDLYDEEQQSVVEARERFCDIAAAMNEIMKNEEKKHIEAQRIIDKLSIQNLIMREILNSNDPDITVEAILERIENRTPIATPNTSVIYIPKAAPAPSTSFKHDYFEPVEDPHHPMAPKPKTDDVQRL